MRLEGDIKIVGEDRMCFFVDPKTLDPKSCSCYDAYAHQQPEPPEMSIGAWNVARHQQWAAALTGDSKP